ncbi:MAG: very short patch repair endonuclease [Treponema sp.]|nr:very short patch repair endonuclease [Treponema sp.]
MDTLSPEDRHINMSRIRSKDTKPEKEIRSALFKAGFRYRICDKRYPGRPDIIFPKYFAVIFINGCFWHAHGWDSSRSSITSSHANDAKAAYAHGWNSGRDSITSSHGNDKCEYFRFPRSNQEFWRKKFERNKERDARVIKTYQDECWRICVVWECAIRGKNSRRKKEKVTEQIIQWLEEPEEPFLEISG